MAVHVIATDRMIDQPLISDRDGSVARETIFDEDSCGAYRGLFVVMLFNVFLIVSGVALWLVLRK